MTEHWYWWLFGAAVVVTLIVGVLWLPHETGDEE